MTKLLIMFALCGALAKGLAGSGSQPPLLIDQHAPSGSLDAGR